VIGRSFEPSRAALVLTLFAACSLDVFAEGDAEGPALSLDAQTTSQTFMVHPCTAAGFESMQLTVTASLTTAEPVDPMAEPPRVGLFVEEDEIPSTDIYWNPPMGNWTDVPVVGDLGTHSLEMEVTWDDLGRMCDDGVVVELRRVDAALVNTVDVTWQVHATATGDDEQLEGEEVDIEIQG
jgi:hypothetical protein